MRGARVSIMRNCGIIWPFAPILPRHLGGRRCVNTPAMMGSPNLVGQAGALRNLAVRARRLAGHVDDKTADRLVRHAVELDQQADGLEAQAGLPPGECSSTGS
jgi:hypothetical protein